MPTPASGLDRPDVPDLSALTVAEALSRLHDSVAEDCRLYAADPHPDAREFARLSEDTLTKLSEAENVALLRERARERLGDPTRPYSEPPAHRHHPVCGHRHRENSGRDPRLPGGRYHP